METGLKGKKALITGGSSGIGKGISNVLADEGVDLAIASRNPDPCVLKELSKKEIKVFGINADVSQENDVVRMISEAKSKLGEIDIYINNAAWTWHQPTTKIDSENWNKTINTNLSSCVWACREIGRYMIDRRKGAILIIGSTVRFNPAYEETSYRISKMGLYMYMQSLALEMAPFGIRVNMVTPGHFKTRMTNNISLEDEAKLKKMIPAERFGDPLEVGNAVAYLLSDNLSRYTYGSELVIDGGLSLNPLNRKTHKEIIELNL